MALAATGLWYQNDLQRRERAENDRVAVRLSEGTSTLIKGKSELAEGRPDEAKLILSNLLTELKGESHRLAGLRGLVLDLLPQADAAIARAKDDAARRAEAERVREQYRRFQAREG